MEININLGIQTKVDAINQVLEALGSIGINAEDEIDMNIDAGSADKLIDAISQKIQSNMGKGYWFNRESFHKLTPDPVTGFVVVPNNTLSCLLKRNNGEVLEVTLRGNQLFDAKNVGYDMRKLVNASGELDAILIMNLPFDYLPTTAKHAITDAAKFWVVNDKEGDRVKMESHQKNADTSMIALMGENARQLRRNMFNNRYIKSDVMLAGGYNNIGGS